MSDYVGKHAGRSDGIPGCPGCVTRAAVLGSYRPRHARRTS